MFLNYQKKFKKKLSVLLIKSQRITLLVDLVYAALKQNPKQTKEDVSRATGLSRATITRTYSELEALGKIKRVGSNKTGYWEVF